MEEKKLSFVREKTKDRPISQRKIFETVLMTVFSGLLFGVVAATTFRVTQYGWESIQYTKSNEEIKLNSNDSSQVEHVEEKEEAKEYQESVLPAISNFEQEYSKLYDIADEARKSMVTIEAIDDKEWFNEGYEASITGTGLLIADNHKELLILADRNIVQAADTIRVIFSNGVKVSAKEKKFDSNTNLSIIACDLADIDDSTKESLVMARFANFKPSSVTGKLIIAAGSPYGMSNSVAIGRITAAEKNIMMQDEDVNILTTDIYGSSDGSGILINTKGEIVGIITTDYSEEDMKNLICAYAISSIHETIERLANGQDKIGFGIFGREVTEEAKSQGIPAGIYVTELAMDSPAMDNGIIVGDVITGIGTNEILSFNDYKAVLKNCQAGTKTMVTLQRYSKGEYKELTMEMEPAIQK